MPADHGKQFTAFMHAGGPNPWKVIILFEELGLSYHMIFVDTKNRNSPSPSLFSQPSVIVSSVSNFRDAVDHKKASYTDKNPNGRLPAIIDHNNNDFTIWESGAILMYLVGKYDKEHKLSFADFDTTAIANQYLMFQMSGE